MGEKMGRRCRRSSSSSLSFTSTRSIQGRNVAGRATSRDNYRVGEPVRYIHGPVYAGYLTFSARCPFCPANFLRRWHTRTCTTHTHVRVRASLCSYGDARVRIRTHRIYCRSRGNCGNDDDGSVRLESEMLPGARDACPKPPQTIRRPSPTLRYPRGTSP